MKLLSRTLSLALLCAALGGAARGAEGPTPGAIRPQDLLFSNSEDTPVVYFKPVGNLPLVLSQVAYNGFGQPEGYTLEIGSDTPAKLTVQVRRDPADKTDFVARVGEQTLAELSSANTKEELVALDPAGGMVLAAPGELTLDVTTEFAYDDFGRRQVAAQTFPHAGAKWKVTFSAYTRDGFGRLTGYRAILSKSE